jgi:hypothetical protein
LHQCRQVALQEPGASTFPCAQGDHEGILLNQALSTVLLTEGAGQQLEHAIPYIKKQINDKIVEVRLNAYKEVASMLDGFSIDNLEKFESRLVIFLTNGLR